MDMLLHISTRWDIFIHHIIVFAVLLALSLPASARIYKCTDSNGKLTFSDRPCSNTDQQEIIKNDAHNTVPSEKAISRDADLASETSENDADQADSDNNPIITRAQLQGTWSDFKEASSFRSIWRFTSTHLHFRKYTGRTTIVPYTLEGNTLTMHHKPALAKPWDETVEIVYYDGKKLTWKWGIQINLYRLN